MINDERKVHGEKEEQRNSSQSEKLNEFFFSNNVHKKDFSSQQFFKCK